MLAKVKAFFHDLWVKIKTDVSNAVALVGTILGGIMAHVDELAATLGDPNLTQQLSSVIADAKWIGRWLLTVGIVTAVAKFKKLVETPKA